MSYIIFVGSAQFLVLILIIEQQPFLAVLVAGIVINLRHLLFGAALHKDIKSKGLKRILLAYLITDEAFLVTKLTQAQFHKG